MRHVRCRGGLVSVRARSIPKALTASGGFGSAPGIRTSGSRKVAVGSHAARTGGWVRLLVSLILAVFVLGPTLCVYDCAADDLASASVVASAAVHVARSEAADHGAGKAQVCPHGGHCHQNPFANPDGGEVQVMVIAYTGVRRILTTSLVPDSVNPSGPERPPRA